MCHEINIQGLSQGYRQSVNGEGLSHLSTLSPAMENFISSLSSRDSQSLNGSAVPADVYQQIEAFQNPSGASKLRNGGRYLARAGALGVFRNIRNTIGNELHKTASSYSTLSEKGSSLKENQPNHTCHVVSKPNPSMSLGSEAPNGERLLQR